MESSPFLPRCPKCQAWPMAVSSVEETFHKTVKFVCGQCAAVSNATIRRATLQRSIETAVARGG